MLGSVADYATTVRRGWRGGPDVWWGRGCGIGWRGVESVETPPAPPTPPRSGWPQQAKQPVIIVPRYRLDEVVEAARTASVPLPRDSRTGLPESTVYRTDTAANYV